MRRNDYNRICSNDNCTNQLSINAQPHRLYCDVCKVQRKKLQLAVIVKRRRQLEKESRLLEIKIVA